ncbi:hypothetical protein [Natrialba aegyptia]|uniref:Uncharacterized protein n=1 Tax=Natrialba aegyptia DSM 13077 TaxID=1227491 RepID=M0B7U4_9EURY|nr:hypothetical protein [Natrialba aegyptia]ELZ05714.1 hypothetical protein C480_09965 [Natrialba aegyptia DSM 13077]
MSVEGESATFEESVPETHTVDPAEVDWAAIGAEHASSDGLLDASHRTDALTTSIDGIENSRQASALLVDAAEQGHIDERNGDYYVPVDGGDRIDVTDVDWHAVFEEVAGGVEQPLPPEGKRNLGIMFELDLANEDEADELVEDALDHGVITSSAGQSGLYLADALDQSTTDTATSTTDDPVETADETTRPELEALRKGSDDLEEYVGQLEGLLTDVLDRLDAVEERQDRQEEQANKFFKENRRQRVGVTEIQMERLQEGKVVSRDGVDENVLKDEFGDNLAIVGDDNNHIRLMNPDTEESGGGGSVTEIPDFDKYCDLEAELLKLNYKVKSKQDLLNERGGRNKYRALVIWRNKYLVGDDQGDTLQISGEDVRETILEYAQFNASASGMDTTANRVMDRFEDWTNGALTKELDKKGRSCLRGDVEDIQDECCPQFRSREGSDGTEGVSPIAMDEIS